MGFYQGSGYTMYAGESDLVAELDALPVTRQGLWITNIHTADYLSGDGVYYAKPYTDIADNRVTGFVILKLDDRSLGLEDESKRRLFYLFEPGGQLVKTNDDAANLKLAGADEYAGRLEVSKAILDDVSKPSDDGVFLNTLSIYKGWTMISYTFMADATDTLNHTMLMLLALAALVFLMMFGLVGMVVSHAVRPMRQLSEHILCMKGEIPERFTTRHNDDEIGVLIDRYNQMVDRIDLQFRQIVEGKQLQK